MVLKVELLKIYKIQWIFSECLWEDGDNWQWGGKEILKHILEELIGGFIKFIKYMLWFPGGSDGKEPACSAGDPGSIPGSERSPGERNGNPLQYPCLENPMDGGAWQTTVHGVAKSWSDFTFTSLSCMGKHEKKNMI